MGLNDITIKFKYRSSNDDIPKEFLVPVLREAISYRRAIGYFSSSSLLYTSLGICSLAKRGGKIQFIASPELSKEDISAINSGYINKEKLIESKLLYSIKEPTNYYEKERYNLLAHLIIDGILEFKIAIIKDESSFNIYHEKIGIIEDSDGNRIAFTGSLNESASAYYGNFESIDVYRSWQSTDEDMRIQDKINDFDELWNNQTNKIEVFEFPEAIREKIVSYKKSPPNYNLDNEQLHIEKKTYYLVKPENVKLREYQIQAIDKWIDNDYRGIFDMATGTGKTFTALGALATLFEKFDDNFGVFVVCPYIHLVDQWAEDVVEWNGNPIICHSNAKDRKWETRLIRAFRKFKYNKEPFLCISTNITFVSKKIQQIVELIDENMNVALIIDEAHNFGAEHLSMFLSTNFKIRLGLSATIERYRDEEGTEKLTNYFGEKCIEYSLQKAILDQALVEYYYHPILVYLNEEELREYQRLTKLISKNMSIKKEEISVSEQGKMLLFKRSRLVAGASNKIKILKEYMMDYREKSHILIYCGATKGFHSNAFEEGMISKQIDKVQRMLGNELGMKTHKFTSEEDAKERSMIKKYFAEGTYQAITAIRCLDEGVNIPEIRTAFILASSRNPKEFIQRRGRLLRKASGKDYAVIYDFITLPRDLNEVSFDDRDSDMGLVKGELERLREFSKYALNSLEGDRIIDEISFVYGINEIINTDELWEEPYYE